MDQYELVRRSAKREGLPKNQNNGKSLDSPRFPEKPKIEPIKTEIKCDWRHRDDLKNRYEILDKREFRVSNVVVLAISDILDQN